MTTPQLTPYPHKRKLIPLTLDDFLTWIRAQPPDRVFNMMNNAGHLRPPAPDHCGCLMMEYAREKYHDQGYDGIFCSYSEIHLYSDVTDVFTNVSPSLRIQFKQFTLFTIVGSTLKLHISASEIQERISTL